MKKIHFFLFMIVCAIHAKAQIRPLNIGDTLPFFTSAKTINHPAGTISLDDYKGKLLILDFWASYCGGCIKAFPKLSAIQQKYPDRVAIVVVTWQKQLETGTFWKKTKGTKDYLFPVITDDSILKQYFPFNSIPHIVWIAPDRTVKAITGPEYVTEKNIEHLLNKEPISWPVKTITEQFDPQQSLLTWNTNVASSTPAIQYTSFTGVLSNIKLYKGIYLDSILKSRRFTIINFTLPAFYYTALSDMGWQQVRQRMIYKIRDSSRFFPMKGKDYIAEWDMRNRFCYEAIHHWKATNEEIAKQLIKDANDFSGFNGHIAKKKMDCWVICRIKEKSGQKLDISVPFTGSFTNSEYMANDISSVLSLRVINEAKDFKGFPIVMAQGDMQNINTLNKRLGLYGLTLKKKKRKMEVFIVEEK